MYQIVTATKKIQNLNKRIRFLQGGTGASKTISALMYLISLAQSDETPTLTSIVSESFPHLRRGARRDFLDILQSHNYFKDSQWNRTDNLYTFETGSKIEFFSADQPSKVRGPRRDRLFLNECNNIPFEAYEQLEVRTKSLIIADYNPTAEFWYHEYIKHNHEHDFIILTYKDNESLPKEIVDSIESRKHRKKWWKVYGLGELGELEGKIYNDWQVVENIPHEAKLERYGMDFGYTNDPTAIVAIYYYNGGYILDEVTYQKGLTNKQIADIFKDLPKALIVADSAEPKSIDELKLNGVDAVPAVKGKDSVRYGIQIVQEKRISMTKRSINLIKEYRNYLWEIDKDGKITKEPQRVWNHCMDALRYGFSSLVNTDPLMEIRMNRQIQERRREKQDGSDYGIYT
jgi:phage terminase large subunit